MRPAADWSTPGGAGAAPARGRATTPAADWSTPGGYDAGPAIRARAETDGAPRGGPEWPAAAGLVAWLAGLALAIWLLQAAGRGVLAPPPLSLAGARRWLQERDGVTVGFAVLRLLAVGLAWYLVVSTLVGVAVRLAGAGRAVRWADTATVPGVRRLLSGVAGAGLTATSAALAAVPLPAGPLSAVPPAAEPAPPDDASPPAVMARLPDGTATMRRLPAAGAAATTSTTAPATSSSTTTPAPSTATTAVPSTTTPTTAGTGTPAPSTPGPTPPQAAPPARPPTASPAQPAETSHPAPAAVETWTIEAGDHLWAVAEETLADEWGRPPTDDEVLAYWTTLVDANRSRLADPGNPDLVFPGQVVVLPPPPPPA
jgi:nucleoid-associated protein YgaU